VRGYGAIQTHTSLDIHLSSAEDITGAITFVVASGFAKIWTDNFIQWASMVKT